MPPHEPLHEPLPESDGLPRAEPLRRAEPGVTPQALRRRLELPSLAAVRELYEAARYLDALALTRAAWRYDAVSLGLDVDELMLAARLALRLGSPRRHVLLMRLARQRAPESPEVELRGRARAFHHGSSFLEARRMLDGVPDGPPDLRSDWLGSASMVLGTLRDFELAETQLASARALEHDVGWIESCAATVALQRDALDEAEARAVAAWELAPGRPATARALMAVRTKQGRALEASELLLRTVEAGGQSFEVLMIALGGLLCAAQATTGPTSIEAARRALQAAEPLERLAPLVDPKLLRLFAFIRAEASRFVGDHELLARHARHVASPFYADVTARLAEGSSGARTILPHRHVAQRHDTCLPASVATCAGVLGLSVDQDALAGEVTWGGTAQWRVLEHAERQGWQARVFTVERRIATELLARGLPFVVCLFGAEVGHACAAVGLDLAMGTLILHDPAGPSIRELLLDKLHVGQAPLGPVGLLLAPPGVDLEGLEWPEQDVQRTRLEVERRVERHGTREAAELARSLTADGDLAAYVRAMAGLLAGRPHTVLDELQALARRHPETVVLQLTVVRCAEEIRNTGLLAKLLEALVLHRHRAGVESNQAWFEVPAGLVARYASLLQGTAEARRRAVPMLHEALWREAGSSACMSVLADLAWEEHRFDDALWAYRWASTLAPDSEPAACAYAWALKKRGQRERGLAWLEARAVRARGHAASGADPWISWVSTLEEFGEPRRGLDEAERVAAEPDGTDGERAAFAARLLARYGRHAAAARALAVAERHATRAIHHATACAVAHAAGELERALEHASTWVQEDPRNASAFAARLSFVRGLQGTAAALELVREQVRERPGNAAFEDMLLAELERHDEHEERERILQARIDDNPLEVWAQRELGHILLDRAQRSSGRARAEISSRAEALGERCLAQDPAHPVTLALCGDLAVLRGDLDEGARCFGEALVRDPDYGYALGRLGDVMARLPASGRPALARHLDRAAEAARHDLDMARDGARLIARLVGLREAERALERWSASSPDDPRLIEARADLQLDHGLGASAAERVRPELEAAVERYPLHAGLRLSLARAYRMLDRHVDAMATYGRLAHDFPHDLGVQHELSHLFLEAGEPETAVELLEEAVRRAPGHAAAWLALARALVEVGDVPRAIEQLRVAHQRMPSDADLLERLADLLRQRGPEAIAEAIQLTTRAAARASASARLLYVHAANLAACGTDPTQVDEAFRRAIESDVHRWEPVHDWSLQLAAAGRHDDALALLERHLEHSTDPSAVEGQRAVIMRKAGAPVRALEVLSTALEDHPDYAWGWLTFMEWVRDDQQPGLARELLPKLSPALDSMPTLQAQALLTWEWAGAEPEWLETQWARLVADHGREPAIILLRADRLLEAGRHAEVPALLERLPKGPRSEPRALARSIRAHVAAGAREPALADVRASWRAQGAGGLPPVTIAALRDAGWLEPAAQAMLADLEAGERVAPGVLVSVAAALAEHHADVVDRLVARLSEREAPESRRALSLVFDAVCDAGRATAVLAWRRKHPEIARRDPDLWLAVARAYLIVGRHEKLVEWFEGWRERDGLEMWGVCNYVQALWQRREWERCQDEARWALEHVAPDPSLPRLARRLVEASLMVGSCTPAQDFAAFVADHDRYGPLLDAEAAGLDPWERQLYADLRALLSLTEPSQLRAPAQRVRDLRRQLVLDTDWRIGVARVYLRHHLGWWQRLWIHV